MFLIRESALNNFAFSPSTNDQSFPVIITSGHFGNIGVIPVHCKREITKATEDFQNAFTWAQKALVGV